MTERSDSVLITRRLTKTFRDFWLREKVTAVSELDLDVRPREVFGLLGPNGSGKSTTLKMVLGLLFPTRGQISVFGRRPTDVAVKRRIGFLPEESYLYPFLDARETLDFYGRLFQQPRRERMRRIDTLLDMVGLGRVAYRRVGEYSKGMQRRIGLAQALINDPDLLILDEPTSGMDPIGTRQFKDLLRLLAQRGKTIVVSSHLLADIEDVCDRVCILYGGKARQHGPVEDLLAKRQYTELTTEALDEGTLRRIEEVLRESGRGLIEVSAPRERLESLFLRIVQEAQSQRVVTGGAMAGGPVADFLTGGSEAQGEQLLERLVQGNDAPPAQTVPAPAPDAPEAPAAAAPARERLETLVRAPEPAPPSDASTDASTDADAHRTPPSAPSAPVNRDMLDRLASGAPDEGEGKESE